MFIELHILQNFAPSCLNRDDTNSPKECEFGGHRRARISSQCQKRAVRKHFKDHDLIPAANRAERTKRLADAVSKLLQVNGRDGGLALRVAKAAVSAFLPKSEDKGEHKTPYLLFLGESEITRFAEVVNQHWEAFSAEPPADAKPATADKPAGRGRASRKQADDGPKAPEGFAKAVEKLLDGGKAADLALFGRMLADLPEKNVDAACQVAHALSTNSAHIEMDYYTAVDDLKPDDTAGADMIGTVEFTAPCFYRYSNIDLGQLTENLQGDRELALKTVEVFLRASVEAIPSGKQNSTAAQNQPSLVFAVVRERGLWSLANAFVHPIRPGQNYSLVQNSIKALDSYWGKLAKGFGDEAILARPIFFLDEADIEPGDRTLLTSLKKNQVGSLKELIEDVMNALQDAAEPQEVQT